VSCVAGVDFEGGDVRNAPVTLFTMPALQNPSLDALLGLGGEYGAGRMLPFERAPEAFGGCVSGGQVILQALVAASCELGICAWVVDYIGKCNTTRISNLIEGKITY
jgi:hypothetical protein